MEEEEVILPGDPGEEPEEGPETGPETDNTTPGEGETGGTTEEEIIIPEEHITQIEVYNNRNAYPREIKLGTIGENNIEKIVFNFPEEYKDLAKQIEFESEDGTWNGFDKLTNNEYIVKNNITVAPVVYAQVVTIGSTKTFICEKIKLVFNDYINAIEQIEEENKDLIEELVDMKVEPIMETTKKELKDYVDECVIEAIGGEY